MSAEALVATMAKTLQDAKAKTPLDTLSDIKADTNGRLVDTLAEAKAELPEDTSRYVEAETLVNTLHYNPSRGGSSDTGQMT